MRSAIFATLVLGLAVAPADSSAAPLEVVTTLEPLALLAREIGFDRVHVVSLTRAGQDPRLVEPMPGMLVRLNRADLLVFAGADLETGWLPPLVANARNPRLQPGASGNLDVSQAVLDVVDLPSGPVNHARGDPLPRGKPDLWIPPANALKIAQLIADRLEELDPADAAAFDANLKAFAEQLEVRSARWSALAANLKGVKIVTFHRSFSCVARWLGLVEIGHLDDAQHLATLAQAMRSQGVKLLVVEPYDSVMAGRVAQQADARIVVMPGDPTYLERVDALLARLTEGAED